LEWIAGNARDEQPSGIPHFIIAIAAMAAQRFMLVLLPRRIEHHATASSHEPRALRLFAQSETMLRTRFEMGRRSTSATCCTTSNTSGSSRAETESRGCFFDVIGVSIVLNGADATFDRNALRLATALREVP
jgi:hypothetical protein